MRKLRIKTVGKTVTRTWITKSGVKKTKTYSYGTRRGAVLVDKKGRVKQKAVEALKASIEGDSTMTQREKRIAASFLDYYVSERSEAKRQLRTTGFFGLMAGSKVEMMFANAGTSALIEAEYLGVEEADLLNDNNWSGDVFTDPQSGRSWRYTFNYFGSEASWEEI